MVPPHRSADLNGFPRESVCKSRDCSAKVLELRGRLDAGQSDALQRRVVLTRVEFGMHVPKGWSELVIRSTNLSIGLAEEPIPGGRDVGCITSRGDCGMQHSVELA